MNEFLIRSKVTTDETVPIDLNSDLTILTGSGIRNFIQVLGNMMTYDPEDYAESMTLKWSVYVGKLLIEKGLFDGLDEPVLWIPSCRVPCMINIRYQGKEIDPFSIRIKYREKLRDLIEDHRADFGEILNHFTNSGFGKIISNRDSLKPCQFNGVKMNGKSPINWNLDALSLFPMQLSLLRSIKSCMSGGSNVHRYIILEDPEIGLHPDYTAMVMHQIFYLISFGYKVIITTNDINVVSLSWAIKEYKNTLIGKNNVPTSLFVNRLFENNYPSTDSIGYNIENFDNKSINLYEVDSDGVEMRVTDLSDDFSNPSAGDMYSAGGLGRVTDSAVRLISEMNEE